MKLKLKSILRKEKKNHLLIGKKGQFIILVALILAVAIFGFSLVSIYVTNFLKEIQPEISETFNQTESTELLDNVVNGFPKWMDNGIVLLFVIGWLMCMIGALIYLQNPLFFVISIVFFIFFIIIFAVMSNSFEEISSDSDLTGWENDSPKINWIMDHFVILLVFITLNILIAGFIGSKGGF